MTEPSPNPESVMFFPDQRQVLGEGMKTKKFSNKYDLYDSPLAAAIFEVRGVKEVLLGAQHITVTKHSEIEWERVQPNVELTISQFYEAGLMAVRKEALEQETTAAKPEAGTLEAQIVELLEERVRPFVQRDGGDIEFDRFEHKGGVLYLRMHGSCSGCPSSSVTLQHGIKNLMDHYIPEVKQIVNVEDEEDDGVMPRASQSRD
jgi:Fe-S cluster biogenesis protein NfuA